MSELIQKFHTFLGQHTNLFAQTLVLTLMFCFHLLMAAFKIYTLTFNFFKFINQLIFKQSTKLCCFVEIPVQCWKLWYRCVKIPEIKSEVDWQNFKSERNIWFQFI